jgi:mannose-6-phosphate isomerase-like protein (cupin superfamily)
MEKPVLHVDDLEYYEQDSGANITYQYVVKPGMMGLLSSGRVRLKGPTAKAMDVHEGWDQAYYVIHGSGVIVVGNRKFRVGPGYVARVPAGMPHGVILARGERMEYIYFNAFKNRRALLGLVKTL